MKKLLPLLLIFMVPSALAATIFDDWVEDQNTFTAAGHSFNVQYIESSQSVIFKMDNIGGIMVPGECETREEIKYCYEDVDYPSIKVLITSLEPDISIERSFSTTSPSLNEDIKVTVTLRNNGDKKASSMKYVDPYPAGLTVLSSANTWTGSLAAAEEKSFTYSIRAQDIVSYESTASLSYYFSGEEKKKKSDTVKITVKKPYTLIDAISTEAADKNEIITYNITIKNEDESNKLTVESLEISFPSKISLVSIPSTLTNQNNALKFAGTIDKGSSKDFVVKVKSPVVGKFTIKTKARLKAADKIFNDELEKTFSVGLSDILPILNASQEVTANSPASIYAAVKNYGKTKIEGVKIKLESDLFDPINVKRDVAAGGTVDIYKKTITTPYVEEDKTYSIKLIGSYISGTGKTYTFEKQAELKVSAPPQIIKITRGLNKEEFSPGEEIKVAITIKNQKNQIINEVDVTDIFPKEIRSSLLGEVTNFLEKLGANEEKKAYSYSVVVPEDYKEDEIEFKTTINANYNDELVILKRIDKVKIIHGEGNIEEKEEIKEIEEEVINKTLEEKEIIEETPKEEVQKPNFFQRIINWFKKIF